MSPQRCVRGLVVAAAAVLLVPAFGQTSSGQTGSGTTPPTTRPPSGTPSTHINTAPGSTAQPTMTRPIRVSGRVMVDDGSPLSFPANIERVCNGSPHTEGYTDSQGYFSITLGQHPEVIGDASETPTSNNRFSLPPGMSTTASPIGAPGTSQNLTGERRIDDCELRANLSGYTSERVNLTGRTSLDNPDVGTILLHRQGASETAVTVTATSLKAPRSAHKALDKGMDLAKKNRPDEAIASMQEAVRIDPQFAFAWCELGKLQEKNDHIPDAHESFEAAVKAEPRWPEPYLHLAVIAVKAHDWNAVAENSGKVLHLNTFQYPQAYFLHGAASFNLHHIDVAETDALNAEKLDVQHEYPQIEKLLGVIFAERQRYAEAADKLRSYLLLAPQAEDAAEARKEMTQLDALASRASQVAGKKDQQ